MHKTVIKKKNYTVLAIGKVLTQESLILTMASIQVTV